MGEGRGGRGVVVHYMLNRCMPYHPCSSLPYVHGAPINASLLPYTRPSLGGKRKEFEIAKFALATSSLLHPVCFLQILTSPFLCVRRIWHYPLCINLPSLSPPTSPRWTTRSDANQPFPRNSWLCMYRKNTYSHFHLGMYHRGINPTVYELHM